MKPIKPTVSRSGVWAAAYAAALAVQFMNILQEEDSWSEYAADEAIRCANRETAAKLADHAVVGLDDIAGLKVTR